MQNDPCGVLPSSFSSSRSRWNTKCKRDAAAPPIWLRRALNDATNTDSIGSLGSNDAQPVSQQSDMCERHPIDDRAALDANRDRQQWRQQPAEGIGSEDASDLYFNPHVFSSRNNNSQQTGTVATSVSLGGGGYASIHAAVSVAGSRTVQSARRTRVSPSPPPPLPRAISRLPVNRSALPHFCQRLRPIADSVANIAYIGQ